MEVRPSCGHVLASHNPQFRVIILQSPHINLGELFFFFRFDFAIILLRALKVTSSANIISSRLGLARY